MKKKNLLGLLDFFFFFTKIYIFCKKNFYVCWILSEKLNLEDYKFSYIRRIYIDR